MLLQPIKNGGLLNRTKKVLQNNMDKPFVKRMFDKNAPVIKNADGSISTHLMAWGDTDGKYAVFPTLVQQGDKLIKPDDPFKYAVENNNLILFNRKRQARKFADGAWKKYVP